MRRGTQRLENVTRKYESIRVQTEFWIHCLSGPRKCPHPPTKCKGEKCYMVKMKGMEKLRMKERINKAVFYTLLFLMIFLVTGCSEISQETNDHTLNINAYASDLHDISWILKHSKYNLDIEDCSVYDCFPCIQCVAIQKPENSNSFIFCLSFDEGYGNEGGMFSPWVSSEIQFEDDYQSDGSTFKKGHINLDYCNESLDTDVFLKFGYDGEYPNKVYSIFFEDITTEIRFAYDTTHDNRIYSVSRVVGVEYSEFISNNYFSLSGLESSIRYEFRYDSNGKLSNIIGSDLTVDVNGCLLAHSISNDKVESFSLLYEDENRTSLHCDIDELLEYSIDYRRTSDGLVREITHTIYSGENRSNCCQRVCEVSYNSDGEILYKIIE